MNQLDIFDLMYPPFKINKEIALIEFFGGYGSQALALKYANIPFKHHKLCEWAVNSIQAYKDVHMENDNTDYSKELSVSEIKDYLFNKGISKNWNEPMTREQIDRLKEKEARTIYNNIQATHNLVNIQQVKGEDLDITDKERFTYLLTYSFPCQDISGAGKMAGFSDTSTRSGMLWEVERILKECKDKPDILLMENVPLIHSQDNIGDFNKWIQSLESMGYKNYWQDLIATDYGIPQTRNRTFMVSVLGNYKYTFPEPIPLKLKLKDLLEDNVDEKYYLSDKCIETMLKYDADYQPSGLSPTLTTELAHHTGKNLTPKIIREIEYSLKIKNANAKGYLEATDGDGIDISSRMEYHRGTVQKGKTQTLTTMGGENNGVVSKDLKIRKLTPKECFRLMGVKDEDINKIMRNQSNASCYHLAGDSIVTLCLMAIIGNMCGIDYKDYFRPDEWWKNN